MKLRIRGDSLRLRLTQVEVAALAERGRVEESIGFAAGERLTYAIACGGTALGAKLTPSGIEVTVPAERLRSWAAGDDVGLEGTQDAGEGRILRILVEKDFACLKQRPHEDDKDAFPNPNTSC
jgi:NOL1/NOP2/fmu family ribosome biogenesis protein